MALPPSSSFPFPSEEGPPPPDRIMIKEPCRGGGGGGKAGYPSWMLEEDYGATTDRAETNCPRSLFSFWPVTGLYIQGEFHKTLHSKIL